MSYIGIDLGTSSVKVLLVTSEGTILDSVSKNYEVSYPEVGYSEQNPNDWWDQTKNALKEIINRHNVKIKAISFSGQMHSLVILDELDQVIRPAILWNDGRTEKQCHDINNFQNNKVATITGNIALTGFTAPKLKWLEENEPEHFKRIKKIMLPKDYIAYQLSGVFATDVNDVSGTLLFDVKNRKYSDEMLQLLNISPSILPKVYESYSVIGLVKEEIADDIGIDLGCKIVIGGGDQAVGAIGTGTVSDGDCFISLGTSGVVFVSKDTFSSNPEKGLHSFAHTNGKYHLMGVMLSAAGAMAWLMENILESYDYEKAMCLINEANYDPDLFFLPYLTGERTPVNDSRAKATFIGLNITHKRKDMLRAVLEGICFGLKDSLELIKSVGTHIESARVIGGGAKADNWLQLLADTLDIRIDRIDSTEGAALGAVILAMVGNQEFNSVQEACNKLIHTTHSFYPRPSNVTEYKEKYLRYQTIYKHVKNI